MTFQIRKADLPCSVERFAELVKAHAEAIAEYERHLLAVAQDADDPNLKPEEKRVAFPPPSALHPLIEQAIRGYEVVGPTLSEKKATLTEAVRACEREAIEANIPAAKRRHWQFRYQDILAADHARLSNHPERIEPEDINAFLASCRPAEDTAFLADYREREVREAAIHRRAAKLEHDIDDLTEETVDTFAVTPFHG